MYIKTTTFIFNRLIKKAEVCIYFVCMLLDMSFNCYSILTTLENNHEVVPNIFRAFYLSRKTYSNNLVIEKNIIIK